MNKKSIIVMIMILGIITFTFYQREVKVVIESGNKKSVTTNSLSINLETAAGSGLYEEATNSSWPSEGYVFNSELSRCERGSEIIWDNANKRVVVSSITSDKCYVYFDVYDDRVKILNVDYDIDGNGLNIYSIQINENRKVKNVYFRAYDVNYAIPDYIILGEAMNEIVGSGQNGTFKLEMYAVFDDETVSNTYCVSDTYSFDIVPAPGRLDHINIIYNGEVIQEYGVLENPDEPDEPL